jgi:hypothetical protein
MKDFIRNVDEINQERFPGSCMTVDMGHACVDKVAKLM